MPLTKRSKIQLWNLVLVKHNCVSRPLNAAFVVTQTPLHIRKRINLCPNTSQQLFVADADKLQLSKKYIYYTARTQPGLKLSPAATIMTLPPWSLHSVEVSINIGNMLARGNIRAGPQIGLRPHRLWTICNQIARAKFRKTPCFEMCNWHLAHATPGRDV